MIWLIGNRGMLGTDVEKLLKDSKFRFMSSDIEVDIPNIEELRKYSTGKDFKWVINCAAYTNVDSAEVEPEKAFRINADGVLNIAKIAQEIRAKLIHISTDYVFDGNKETPYDDSDLRQTMLFMNSMWAILKQKKAMEEVENLRGILPLCSFCKKIRNDKGYWEQVDIYIHKHSQADISHSVCPDCLKKEYSELSIGNDHDKS